MAVWMAYWMMLVELLTIFLAGDLPGAGGASCDRRCSSACVRTALVRAMFFSNPMVTTKKGRPSDNRTMVMGTPSFVVTIKPKRKAKTDENSTVVPSQTLEPSLRMDTNSDTKVRCMEM